MAKAEVREGSIERVYGSNLATVIAHGLVDSPEKACMEFVNNSYDADATNMRVTVNTLEDILVFEDDGSGMNEEGIANFYRMGDSEKVSNPISRKGRTKIGKFGIATVLLEYLAKSYTLETWRDGQKIVIDESFAETKRGVEPQVDFEEVPRDQHGTRITLRGLNFTGKAFNTQNFRYRLEWGVPSIQGFDIWFNGVLVPKRTFLQWCTEYAHSLKVPGVGEVDMHLYTRDHDEMPHSGVFVYVNGEAIGDNRSFDSSMKRPRTTLVMVNADGLRQHIRFDRGKFREDIDAYQNLRNEVVQFIRDCEPDIARGGLSKTRFFRKRQREVPQIMTALKNAEARLNSSLEQTTHAGQYVLEMTMDPDSQWTSRFRNGDSTIEINVANPLFSFASRSGLQRVLEPKFLLTALEAIANRESGLEQKPELLREFDASVWQTSERLYRDQNRVQDVVRGFTADAQGVVPVSELELHRYRMYTHESLTEITGRDINTIKRLAACGLLHSARKERMGHKYGATEVLTALREVEGYEPVARLVSPDRYDASFKIYAKTPFLPMEDLLARQKKLPEWFKNVGKDHPFYFVKSDRAEDARAYVRGLEDKK